jgi:glycosyltransferase involved in cell wall biosynthesis
MKIGYVVPTLGLKIPWLKQSLASIRTYDNECEIVLIANQISEDLTEVAKTFSASLLLEARPGLFAAVNQGVSFLHEKGVKIFSFLGDDDILMPSAGQNLLKGFSDSSTLAVYGQVWYVDENLGVLMKNTGYPHLHRFQAWIPNLIPNPGTLISVDAWRRVGGYNEHYNWAGDLDFWIKLRKFGKIKFIDVPMSFFRWHEGSHTAGRRNSSVSEATLVRTNHTKWYLLWFRKPWELLLTNFGERLRRKRMSSPIS